MSTPVEMLVVNDELGRHLKKWLEESGFHSLSDDAKTVLSEAYREGWSGCLNYTMKSSIDLAMILLQAISAVKKAGMKDGKIVLSGQALVFVEQLCQEIVGQPEDWQLDEVVKMAEHVAAPSSAVREETEVCHLRVGDFFDYPGSFRILQVLSAPEPCPHMSFRFVFRVKNVSSERQHELDIRLPGELRVQVLDPRSEPESD